MGHVLGIDTSLTATAVASSAGWVEVVGAKGRFGATYPERLARIAAAADAVTFLISGSTELIIIEGPSYRSADPSTFDRAHLWWLIYAWCTRRGFDVAVVTPSQRMLYATGKGNVKKGAVIDAVARRWPLFLTGGDDNAADAVVLMAMGLDRLGTPLAPMPAAHRRALDKVAWPEGI